MTQNIFHFEDTCQSDGFSVFENTLIGIGEHGNKQVEKQYKIDHDEEDEIRLTGIYFKC